MKCRKLISGYALQTAACMIVAVLCGAAWAHVFLQTAAQPDTCHPLVCAVLATLLLPLAFYRQWRLYRQHTRKVLFMLDAIENNDYSIRFSEEESADTTDSRLVNRALNRVSQILYHVKSETAQQEKYYELILDCVNTGVLVLNDNGAVYQKNREALRLLGLEVFTHVSQLARIDSRLMQSVSGCRPGDKLQVSFGNERGTTDLSIRVSDITVHQEHLRILALNDINNELDEKEIDSWVRLTRVLTHEIMNAVTPITSLSETLLERMGQDTDNGGQDTPAEEMRHGLHTIHTTGKGLLAFVESYRKFTRIPTPVPSLFYVKGFIHRMIELARHQYPDASVTFRTDIAPDDLILHADENLVSQVVTNLLKNAIQAFEASPTPSSGEKRIAIRAYCDENEAVLIEVSNNGPGIPPAVAEHIFIPFFTTKANGSGIGLSISRQIMRLSGGSISLIPGRETTFVLKFN